MYRPTTRSLFAQCLLAAVVVACGSGSDATPTPDTTTGECCTPPIETILITEAPDPTPAPVSTETVTSDVAVVVTEPNLDGIMPDVLCMDLQEAQNLIQTRGVFFSRSEDASGDGRRQIIDSNWIVIAQRPAAGEPIGEGDAVLSVLKDAEVTECTPGVGGS